MTNGRENDRYHLSSSMKLADLIDINYNILGIMSRLGLKFGFGDETVEEACLHNGVDADTFLLVCNVYTFDSFHPSANILARVDLRNIVDYLRQSHSYYMDIILAGLEGAMDKMLQPCDPPRKAVIWKFFTDYKTELAKHFEYEEKIVFPYVESVLQSEDSGEYSILQYEENHTNVEEKLGDLKNIVMKYLPPECDNQLINYVLMNLFTLGRDLEKHTKIEDDILVPAVNHLEEKLRGGKDGK